METMIRFDKPMMVFMKRGKIMSKRRILFIFIIISALYMGGCWNYSEVNEKKIVAGAAIDYNKEKEMLELTIEVVRPMMSGDKTEFHSEYFTSTGDNLFNAIRNMISKTGKKIFWSHAKVLILSEDIIKEKDKLLSIIDFIKRDAETRDDIMLLVSREKTSKEILKTDIRIHEITSFHLEDMLQNQKSISKYRTVPLWKFTDELSTEGISATLPTVNVVTYNKKQISQIFGTAIFKGAKKVGWLNGIETKAFLFIIDELKGGVITIEEAQIAKKLTKITFEIFDSKTKVRPIYEDKKLIMKIDIKTTANIIELDDSIDFMDEDNLNIIQKNGEDKIKRIVKNVIKKTQEEYKSDIFGFGAIISREKPELWKEIKSNWDDIFTELEIQVDVALKIRGSSLRSKPIEIGD